MRVSMFPEGYFADFAKKMAASLPEKQIPAKRKPTRWLRIRPYVYMAAMFAGVWCMGYLFKDLKTRSGEIAARRSDCRSDEGQRHVE